MLYHVLGAEVNIISVSGNGENIVEQDEFPR